MAIRKVEKETFLTCGDYSVITKEDYEKIIFDVRKEYFEEPRKKFVPKFLFPIIKENPKGKVPKYKYAGDGGDDKISLYNQEDQINLRIFIERDSLNPLLPDYGKLYFPDCTEENGLVIPVIYGKWKKRTL